MKSPDFNLSQEEAREYAESVAAVARHYDVGASAKTLDWINLGTTMASIYGLRVMTVAARRRNGTAGPVRNGHDPAPAAEQAPEEINVDFSLMTGPPRGEPQH